MLIVLNISNNYITVKLLYLYKNMKQLNTKSSWSPAEQVVSHCVHFSVVLFYVKLKYQVPLFPFQCFSILQFPTIASLRLVSVYFILKMGRVLG